MKTQLILASQSPRRSEILKSLGYVFSVIPAQIDEHFNPHLDIDVALQEVARRKAKAVYTDHPDAAVLAADTIVYSDYKILGKPGSREEAISMIRSLSGKMHEVKTGLCLIARGKIYEYVVTSRVFFRPLDDETINAYLDRNTYLDKAGSYGIQETDFVDRVEGSYSNVVGLPMGVVDSLLKELQSDPSIKL